MTQSIEEGTRNDTSRSAGASYLNRAAPKCTCFLRQQGMLVTDRDQSMVNYDARWRERSQRSGKYWVGYHRIRHVLLQRGRVCGAAYPFSRQGWRLAEWPRSLKLIESCLKSCRENVHIRAKQPIIDFQIINVVLAYCRSECTP